MLANYKIINANIISILSFCNNKLYLLDDDIFKIDYLIFMFDNFWEYPKIESVKLHFIKWKQKINFTDYTGFLKKWDTYDPKTI